MRIALSLATSSLVLLAACQDTRFVSSGDVDMSRLSNTQGVMTLADGASLPYAITSEAYKQWDAAQDALSPKVVARFGRLLRPAAPTQESIARAVTYLEGDPASRQAIERAGLTVRAFVQLTVALEQQMRLAGAGQPAAAPAPPAVASRDDSIIPVGEQSAAEVGPDTATAMPRAPVATVRADTLFPVVPPRPDSAARRPARRDTVATPRDTLGGMRPSTTPPAAPAPDTTRGVPVTPPDSLRPR